MKETPRPKAAAPTPAGGVGGTAPAVPTTYRSKTEARLREWVSNPIGFLLIAVIVFVVAFYPFIDEGLDLNKITDVIPILIYIILALGLNVVVGYAGLLDLGYAAFFAIGAYVAALLTSGRSILNLAGPGWWSNFWIAIVVAFFVAILAGIILGAPTLRLRGDYLAIVTLGFGEIVPVVFRNATDITYGEKGLGPIARPVIGIPFTDISFEIGGQPVPGLGAWSNLLPWYYLLLVIGVFAIMGLRRLQDSRVGRAWMAMREDEIAASAMGINLVTTKLAAFGMGASLSGAAGAVFGAYLGSVFPSSFEFSTSVILLCAVILGGLGNIWGVILGSVIIQFFDRILTKDLTAFFKQVGTANDIDFLATLELSNFRFFLFGAALVIMMLVRPEGLVPSARRRAELRPEQDTVQGEMQEEGPGFSGPGIETTPITAQERATLYDAREAGESVQEER
jgi:branched-chain amino acid transport system permease protein